MLNKRHVDKETEYTEVRKCQIGEPLSRIEEDGRNWLRRANLCIKRCRAVIIIIIIIIII
jgi:hypothetical protein